MGKPSGVTNLIRPQEISSGEIPVIIKIIIIVNINVGRKHHFIVSRKVVPERIPVKKNFFFLSL